MIPALLLHKLQENTDMQTVLISGGTGLVGKALTKKLIKKGYRVIVLSRKSGPGVMDPESNQEQGAIGMGQWAMGAENKEKQYEMGKGQKLVEYALWDIKKKEIDLLALQEADYIIHLAGAGVMDKKWTAAYKKEIMDSRVESANLITGHLKMHPNKVKAVIAASAIGWYSPLASLSTGGAIETEKAAADFLGETCRLWEASMDPVIALGKRLVKLRIGIVLGIQGGALREFIKPLSFGIAAILGSGKQLVSWVHIDDLCRIFIAAIENENMHGVYNAVAPNPVTAKELTIALAKKINPKFYLPVHVPAFVLKLMLGGRSIEILKSSRISSKKIQDAGYTFIFDKIDNALDDLINT
jgi:uncharacterized protein (TIGR01777 family)